MSESAKPIEKGCLAMIINAPEGYEKYNGMVVTIFDFVPAEKTENKKRSLWQISIPREFSKSGWWGLNERYLLRIDPNTQSQIESERLVSDKPLTKGDSPSQVSDWYEEVDAMIDYARQSLEEIKAMVHDG